MGLHPITVPHVHIQDIASCSMIWLRSLTAFQLGCDCEVDGIADMQDETTLSSDACACSAVLYKRLVVRCGSTWLQFAVTACCCSALAPPKVCLHSAQLQAC